MNAYFTEFRKFINRGNVIDLAVGIIIGSSFTAIVNALSNNVLRPVVNFLLALAFDADSLSELYLYLKTVYTDVLDESGAVIAREIDLSQSIYIDWGALIIAVINFFLIAIVLFTIVKLINKFVEGHRELTERVAERTFDREERRELRAHGISPRNKEAAMAYFAEKKRIEDEETARREAEAAEAARLEREKNPTAEQLLARILEVISGGEGQNTTDD